ncbi:MAG: vitamin B12 dependent-methionine synthase activation domain-containing protein [Clostridia bacterium]|nr:vitamin B12 dependent-methionine synthase activation domain-containing protein [Clostridia bacterium]
MIEIYRGNSKEIEIQKGEVYRYLGYGKREPDEKVQAAVEKCILQIGSALNAKACRDKFEIRENDGENIDLGFTAVKSRSLARNLKNCSEIILFTATIGIETDRIINRYSPVSPSAAVIAQAVGTAYIEAWCDLLCSRFEKEEREKGNSLRPRFSPGYGDAPLEMQKSIFSVLDCSRKIGVSLSNSLLMLPSKSVSAIIGISKEQTDCAINGCEACAKADCPYRRS